MRQSYPTDDCLGLRHGVQCKAMPAFRVDLVHRPREGAWLCEYHRQDPPIDPRDVQHIVSMFDLPLEVWMRETNAE